MFTVQGPNGDTFQVDAPDAQSAAQAVEQMLAGGGGQDTMRGGGMFDDLPTREEARGQRAAPMPAQGDAPPQAGGMFDDVGISSRDQFQQAFDPSNPRNRAAERPELSEAMDDRLHGGADNQGRYWTAMNSLNMGFGDELAGLVAGGLEWAKGGDFDQAYNQRVNAVRGTIDRYAERHPVESTALDIAGSLPTAAIPGGAAVKGANLMTKMGRGAAAGATYGAARGFGEGEGGFDNRMEGALWGGGAGGLVGGAVPAIGAGIGKVAGKVAGRRNAPAASAVDQEARSLFQRAEQSGVQFKPQALQGLSVIGPRMQGGNRALPRIRPEIHPQTLGALQVVDDVSRQPSITFADVMTTRGVLRDFVESAKPGSPDEREAIRVLEAFDGWSDRLKPRDLVAGSVTGRDAFQMYGEARRLWTVKKKADEFERIVRNAELERGKAGGFEAALKSGFKSLAKKQWAMRSFTAGEQAAIREVARGGPARWFMQALESVMPDKDLKGLVAAGVWGTAGTALGPAGTIAVPAAGAAAGVGLRSGIRGSIRGAANRADAMVRSGGQAPFSVQAADKAADYATRLLGAGGQAGNAAATPEIQIMFPNDAPVWR